MPTQPRANWDALEKIRAFGKTKTFGKIAGDMQVSSKTAQSRLWGTLQKNGISSSNFLDMSSRDKGYYIRRSIAGRQWDMCADTVSQSKLWDLQDRAAVWTECKTRDRLWLGTGKEPKAVYETDCLEDHEKSAYEALSKNGIMHTVKAVLQKNRNLGKSSPDVHMNGEVWELKCPDGSNVKKTVSRNINNAIRQLKKSEPKVDEIRVILSQIESPLPLNNFKYQIQRKLKDNEIDECLLICKDGSILRFKK